MIFACFHSLGNVPYSILVLNKVVGLLANADALSFKSLAGIQSAPVTSVHPTSGGVVAHGPLQSFQSGRMHWCAECVSG